MDIIKQGTLTRRGLLCALFVCGALRRPAFGMPTWPVSATDAHLVLCVVGILQPASSAQVYRFLRRVFDGEEAAIVAVDIRAAIKDHVESGRLLRVQDSPEPLFSLTFKGNASLAVCWSRLRDRARMFLLRGRPGCKIAWPREDIPAGLTGASPVSLIRASIQRHSDGGLGHTAEEGFAGIRPGLLGSSRGKCLPLLSFESLEQLARAGPWGDDPMLLNPVGISLALGVSAHFLEWLASRSDKNYRQFTITSKKSSKKKRIIESPRVFLKITQRFLLYHIFAVLNIHSNVHSFRNGRSCISNAIPHEGMRFVAKTDIVDFFGSLSSGHIRAVFSKHHFPASTVDLMTKLCTYRGRLPQGAPTSPLLSNAALFDFDSKMVNLCHQMALNYTRYADDITISGDDRADICAALGAVQANLSSHFGLRINKAKTRVIHRSAQQCVTGVVVNQRAVPPRVYRRRVRAMFDRAERDPIGSLEKPTQLVGHRSYLDAFPKLAGSDTIRRYDAILARLAQV